MEQEEATELRLAQKHQPTKRRRLGREPGRFYTTAEIWKLEDSGEVKCQEHERKQEMHHMRFECLEELKDAGQIG